MRPFPSRALLVAICLTVSLTGALSAAPGSARAQAEPGDIGLFADPGGTLSAARIHPGQPVELYVVVFPPENGVRAFEVALRLPASVVANWTILPDYVSATPLGAQAWLVSLRNCVLPPQPFALIKLTVFALDEVVDAPICLGPVPRSSLGTEDFTEPVFASCVSGSPVSFGVAQSGQGWYPDGCLILNPTLSAPVELEQTTFSTVKATFGG